MFKTLWRWVLAVSAVAQRGVPLRGLPVVVGVFSICLNLTSLAQRLEVRAEPTQVMDDEMVALHVFLHDTGARGASSPVVSTPDFTVETLPPETGRWIGNGILWRYMLVPNRAGTFRVGVSVTLDEQLLRGEAVVRVIERRLRTPTRGPAELDDLTGRRFVRAVVDRTTAYVHQQITYRFRYFYENLPPTGEAPQYALPAFNGFLSRQLGSAAPVYEGKETVDGRIYYVEEIHVALFPLTAGTRKIQPTRLVLPPSPGAQRREIQTEPVEVTILPLPEPTPTDFSGGVGNFLVTTEIVETSGRVGEPVRLQIRFDGSGNLQTLTNIPKPEALVRGDTNVERAQVYEPSITDELRDTGGQPGGVRTIEYVLVPAREGMLEVRMPGFSMFSTLSGRYVRIEPTTFSVQVEAGENPADRNEARPRTLLRRVFQSPIVWLIVLGGAIWGVWKWLPALGRLFSGGRMQEAGDVPSGVLRDTTNRGASDSVSKHRYVSKGERIQDESPHPVTPSPRPGDGRRFSGELGASLRKYAVKRFRLSADPVSYASVLTALRTISDADAERFIRLLNLCEEGEFSPASLSVEEQSWLLAEARDVMERSVS